MRHSSSAAHPAVINRMLSSDNAARKQTCPLVPEEFFCVTDHKYFLLFMANMCKSCSKLKEAHDAFGILCSLSNNTSDLTPGVNHLGA